jgi:hypothetical protein
MGTPNLLQGTLGIPMVYGRGIGLHDPDEVVVLDHRFWRKYFNGVGPI